MAYLYVARNLEPLRKLLVTENDKSPKDIEERGTKRSGMNMWLIHIHQTFTKNGGSTQDLLELTPLRLNSYVFEFYEGNAHKILMFFTTTDFL